MVLVPRLLHLKSAKDLITSSFLSSFAVMSLFWDVELYESPSTRYAVSAYVGNSHGKMFCPIANGRILLGSGLYILSPDITITWGLSTSLRNRLGPMATV